MMTDDSIRTAAILLLVFPTVVFGGVSILSLWITRRDPYLRDHPLRQRLWAAGHAHAGVLLLLSLVALVLLQEAELSGGWRSVVRWTFPASAILVPAAYFLSILRRDAEHPNALVNLAYVGAVSLTIGMITLGIGLLRAL
jgi:hypothetical protein